MSKPVEKPEWAHVAEAFEASGLTQKAFSAQRGVRLSTLQSWVYRARRAATTRAEPVRLLPVQVAASPAATESLLEVVAEGVSRTGAMDRMRVGQADRLGELTRSG
ncbi:IS66 family insertion sequence element accessory protein TnpA, partial [Corallococcus silvisoli]|uniref:IS66 family insertion sequence element accessory protein TnpA n=1 Tax=Corallococcus silvisoli TaxID=2697031 RepID=UPI001F44DB49